ncbi:hypothetical protein COO60DRAFT_830788 [Scenedesmus sp. NREL 46B-D3]|nr:hypothetical protein COO60DRAFT_830788 [Scenedesmus sp. NREL 46B-D3]
MAHGVCSGHVLHCLGSCLADAAQAICNSSSSSSRTSSSSTARSMPSLLQLLGLQLDAELLPAVMHCLLMVLTLFSGPLAYQLHFQCQQQQQPQQQQQQQRCIRFRRPSIHSVRDCIVAPVTEEWCFRACMVPLLWMEGAQLSTIILVAPLFFGVGHFHHVHFLVKQGWSVRQALQMVCFQLLYTTAFGWYATWVFCWTGKLLPAIAVHAFSNLMGVPPFGDMAAGRGGAAWMVLTVAGIAAFAWLMRAGIAGWQQYTSVYSHQAVHAG